MNMPFSESIPIVLDKPRNLLFTAYSLFWLSKIYEDPHEPFQFMGKMSIIGNQIKMNYETQKKFYDVLTAGLVHEDEGLTPEYLMKNMPLTGVSESLIAIAQAIKTQFTQRAENEAKENPQ